MQPTVKDAEKNCETLTLEERLDNVTAELADIDKRLKEMETQKEALRAQFFALATEQVPKEIGLRKRAVEVPQEFFDSTKMSLDEFVESRFPGWRLDSHEEGTRILSLIIEEDPDFKSWSYTNPNTHQVFSKQVSAPPVELDDATLKLHRPDIWVRVMTARTVYEPNAKAMQKAIADDPTLRELFQFHTRYTRKPTRKLGPIRAEKSEE